MDIPPGSEALVEYDYEAQHADELTIRMGDTVTDLTPTEPGWMRGKLRGKIGVFPDNFVKMVHRDAAKPKPKLTQPITNSLNTNGVTKRPGRRRCRALFSYAPEKADELELKLHDVIEVLEEVEPGWWKGSLNGKVGVFPSNFVEELPPAEPEPVQEIKPKPVKGVGLGDILKNSKARPPPPQLAKPPDPAADAPAPQLPPKPVKELCKALFAYPRQNDDELTLKEGDIVTIVSKESEDKGWWRGELNGRVGVFPDNFVEVISLSEKPVRPEKPPSKPHASKSSESDTAEPAAAAGPASAAARSASAAARSASVDAVQQRPSLLPQPPAAGLRRTAADATQLDGNKKDAKPDGDTSLEEFDAVERDPERLAHITVGRPRAPGRRPPSTIFNRDSEPELTNGSIDGTGVAPSASSPTSTLAPPAGAGPAPPWMRELQRAQNKRISRLDEENASGDSRAAPEETDSAAPASATASTSASSTTSTATSATPSVPAHKPARADRDPPADAGKPRKPTLRSSTAKPADLSSAAPPRPLLPAAVAAAAAAPATTAATADSSKPAQDQLREEVAQLRKQLADQGRQFAESLTALRTDYQKRMRTVLDELDAEKKARLVMQVQLDRLDKLVKDMNFAV